MPRGLLLPFLLLTACGGGRPDPSAAPASAMPALASFAATRMIVLPTQGLRTAGMGAWSDRVGGAREMLALVDTAMERTLRERRLDASWSLASDLAQTARRNPIHAADPAAVRAGDAVRAMERRNGSEIPEPTASQLRALAGFHDSRHALVPVELRLEPGRAPGTGRAVLHVAILDVRMSRLAWAGDIVGADANDWSATMVTDLAVRFADLLTSR